MERVPQPCLNENCRNLSQLHDCRPCCLFLLLNAKNHHPQLPFVLMKVIPSAERVVLEYREAVIKKNW